MAAAKNAVATATAPQQMVKQDNLPDYLRTGTGAGRGNEHVEMSDYVIPRVELVQALSPCLKASDPSHIAGVSQGDMYNSVTRELYGDNITVIPVAFKKEYLVWKDRKEGGGFRGAYPSLPEAQARIETEPDADKLEAQETAQQIVLVVKGDGTLEEAVVSMAKTKLKISKQWNSLIRINSNDRFSRTYILSTAEDSNDKGDFWNFSIANKGFATLEQFKRAESMYEAIASGARRVVVDQTDGDAATETGSKEY